MIFTTQSASEPVVATCSSAWMGPARVSGLGEHVGLVGKHVGAAAGKALVVGHVLAGHARGGGFGEGHGVGRVAQELVELGAGRGLLEANFAVGLEVHRLALRLPGRPGIEGAPLVGAAFKHGGFGQRWRAGRPSGRL